VKACVLHSSAPIETNPLVFEDYPAPQPANGKVLVRVSYCGVCRTDLHVIERELVPQKSPKGRSMNECSGHLRWPSANVACKWTPCSGRVRSWDNTSRNRPNTPSGEAR
jgi:hypothetical protein